EGSVEIWDWSSRERQRFRMFVAGLNEGDEIRFEIRKRNSDDWETFATRTAILHDEHAERYVAKVDTEWFGVLPLHADEVSQLVGLGVRVVRETDDGDVVLLIGEIPDLVRD
ncbi:MAG: hypothetical protein ACYTGZ_08835, partial [Planctomycetota bacterium]